MDIARYFIERHTSSWMVTLILLLGGIIAFLSLGRLEDPEFTIKKAMIITSYPGASPTQVEEEVTYPLENAIQQLPYVDNIQSLSSAGRSQITVEMKSIYRKQALRGIWEEMRRKINDLTPSLPPGVRPPLIRDDFGDVYGTLLAITGEGYSYRDIRDYADQLRRELVLVPGVGKVSLQGEQPEQVIVEMSRARLAALGMAPKQISALLANQNQVSNAGSVRIGNDRVRFHPTGEFASVEELAQLLISQPGAQEPVYLGDVANIYRDYQEIPNNIVRYQGQQALLLGVSFASGVNVVEVGNDLQQRLGELAYLQPVGMQAQLIYNQAAEVERSVQSFLVNLAQAVMIVVLVLLAFMGMRSGLLIGLILLITVLGSFIFMAQLGIELHRISLGALIIALGMLVDNAIVVTEGILVGQQRGQTVTQAASQVVKQNKWPLLGATVIAIIAFAPIGLSSDATGEFAGSLFWVLLISLLLSWLTAITLTPFFASLLFSSTSSSSSPRLHQTKAETPYQGVFFTGFKQLLEAALRWRRATVFLMLILLSVSVLLFGKVKQAFFPPSTTPIFLLDIWQPAGTDIRQHSLKIQEIEQFIKQQSGVEQITTTVGQGLLRFMLTYQTEKAYPNYGQIVVRMQNIEMLEQHLPLLQRYLREEQADVFVKVKRLEIGPSTDAKIEARFTGPDPKTLRQLAVQAEQAFAADAGISNVRNDWHHPVKVLRPQFNEAAARQVGVSKSDVDETLLTSFNGIGIGLYRDGTNLLPIISRLPEDERQGIDNIDNLQVYSASAGDFISLTQVVSGLQLVWEDPYIVRRDRKRTLTVMADPRHPDNETAAQVFARVRPAIEAIPLPTGYQLTWGGEFEASSKAKQAIFGSLPLGYLVMFVTTVLLFSSLRTASVIWASIPLALIGVSAGLLITGAPFSFMALLGFLSLSGMIIKNGIVLVEQITLDTDAGLGAYHAVLTATMSRVRPVCMAAVTTILGMIPLLYDAFFVSMAVVIMFGLGFATLLTLVFVPVLYSMIYRIEADN